MTNDSVSENVDLTGLRALFEEAAAGLSPGEREVIELQLRQGLAAEEVAAVLGVAPGHARLLVGRAASQLEACLTVLLVGRAGRRECGALGAMLADWDGRLTAALRKRVHRHIVRCATCAARRAAELRSARLLHLSPGAALAAGAAESWRAAPRTPSALKAHTIALATGRGPAAAAHSTHVLARVGAFGKQGFPKPARIRRARISRRRCGRRSQRARPFPPGQATAATGAVVVVTAAAVAYALTGTSQHFLPSAYPSRRDAVAAAPSLTPAGATRGNRSAPSAVGGVPVPPDGAHPFVTLPWPARSTRPAARPTGSRPGASWPGADEQVTAPPRPTWTGPASGNPASMAAVVTQGAARQATRPAAATPLASKESVAALANGGLLMALPGWLGSLIALGAADGSARWPAPVADDRDQAVSASPSSGTLSPGGTWFPVWPGGLPRNAPNGSSPLDGAMPLPSVTESGMSARGTVVTHGRTVGHA